MVILWNPSIRRKLTLTLPEFNSTEFEESHVILGFGYDKISDDYKVVSLTYLLPSSIRPQVEVYTVKTGIWREVMFPHNLRCFYIIHDLSRIFFNGCVHWIAYDPTPGVSHYSIMTFDITTELFGEIEVPWFLAEKFTRVSVVGESLDIIHSSDLNFHGLKSGSKYLVMVMKEYKNPASWTVLCYKHYAQVDLGKPLRLRNNRDMIVELKNGDTIMFNNNEGSYVYLFRDCVEDSDWETYVDRYEESLALLDAGDSVPDKEAMKALMMIEKQDLNLTIAGRPRLSVAGGKPRITSLRSGGKRRRPHRSARRKTNADLLSSPVNQAPSLQTSDLVETITTTIVVNSISLPETTTTTIVTATTTAATIIVTQIW